MYTLIPALIIILTVTTLTVLVRKHTCRCAGLIQGVALQMGVVVPVVVAQMTGYAWSSWSYGSVNTPLEIVKYVGMWCMTILFDMAGWTVVSSFQWLVPVRQTTVLSNLGEFGVLWIAKVMLVAGVLAWRREHRKRTLDWCTILMLMFVLLDSWFAREFPWWGS